MKGRFETIANPYSELKFIGFYLLRELENDPESGCSESYTENQIIAPQIDCSGYLRESMRIYPRVMSFDIGSEAQEIDITPALLASEYTLQSFDSSCGTLQASILNIDSSIATVTLAVDERSRIITGSRLRVDPSAE